MELAARRLRAQGHKRLERITLDIDGLPLPVHGEQPGSAYNGHVRERMHYPLVSSCAETRDLLAGLLRDGNAGPAQQAATCIPRIVQAARTHLAPEVQVRLDASFTDSATLAALDVAQIPLVGRLRENSVLNRLFDQHRMRGPGRPATQPWEWVVEARYQPGSWDAPRRLLIVVQEHPTELLRNTFFLSGHQPAPRSLLWETGAGAVPRPRQGRGTHARVQGHDRHLAAVRPSWRRCGVGLSRPQPGAAVVAPARLPTPECIAH